jgi:hydroxymethylpyrimidine pyrophosphatase-like HAD family hydrolase
MDTKQTVRSDIYVFDLDGVITDPNDSSVDIAAVRHIYDLLEQGCLVAVNSGRSFEWIDDNLLKALENLDAAGHFDRLLVVCEKGGECVNWTGAGFEAKPSRFALDQAVCDIVRQTFAQNKSALTTMFWDATKKTMATIEKEPSADLGLFVKEQRLLTTKLQEALSDYEVRIDPTTIATDIESYQAGKHAGAELIYEWVSDRLGARPESFISFGDSKSDYAMAVYFAQQGSNSKFVFVGSDEDVLDEQLGVSVIRTTAKYAKGTLEYFAG